MSAQFISFAPRYYPQSHLYFSPKPWTYLWKLSCVPKTDKCQMFERIFNSTITLTSGKPFSKLLKPSIASQLLSNMLNAFEQNPSGFKCTAQMMYCSHPLHSHFHKSNQTVQQVGSPKIRTQSEHCLQINAPLEILRITMAFSAHSCTQARPVNFNL